MADCLSAILFLYSLHLECLRANGLPSVSSYTTFCTAEVFLDLLGFEF